MKKTRTAYNCPGLYYCQRCCCSACDCQTNNATYGEGLLACLLLNAKAFGRALWQVARRYACKLQQNAGQPMANMACSPSNQPEMNDIHICIFIIKQSAKV